MISATKLDLSKKIAEIRERSSDDEDFLQTDVQRKITDLQLKIVETELQQEVIRLERLKKNNDRRPKLFTLMLYVIAAFYGAFAVCVFNGPNPVDVLNLGSLPSVKETFSYFMVLMILLAVIPTVLLIVLIKAVFSPQEKNQKELLDSIPVVTVAKSIVEK